MSVRQLACLDGDGNMIGILVCTSDEEYEDAVENIRRHWDLPHQLQEDLPSLKRTQQEQQ